jgi:hypothetical protein
MRELVTKASDRHHSPSSQIAVRCSQTHLQNDQKVSISSTHFTIHHHQHRFSFHQQKFTRILFLTRPCMTDCFALSASLSSDSHVSRNWAGGITCKCNNIGPQFCNSFFLLMWWLKPIFHPPKKKVPLNPFTSPPILLTTHNKSPKT